jgi:hypothetical protein
MKKVQIKIKEEAKSNGLVKVTLRPNLRYHEEYQADFEIRAGEIKEIKPQMLKSYAIRALLWAGDLILVEGEVNFTLKTAKVTIKAGDNFATVLEDGKVHYRNLDTREFVEAMPQVLVKGGISTMIDSPSLKIVATQEVK